MHQSMVGVQTTSSTIFAEFLQVISVTTAQLEVRPTSSSIVSLEDPLHV